MSTEPISTANPAIRLSARRLQLWLFLVTFALTLAHVVMLIIYFVVADPDKFDFVELIDMDYEGNLPTLFSACLFFLNALLLLLLSQVSEERSWRIQWLGLTLIFFFLGVDEGVKLHEYVGDMMEQFVDAEGFLYFPWVLPYMAAFALLVLVYLRFFLHLPRSTKKEFVVAAVVFLSGAVVLDVISAKEADLHGTDTLIYSVLYTLEEVLEMCGLILFFGSLVRLVGVYQVQLSLTRR